MPFQFLCPQGHLLEGVESQMGQQCQCPVCGLMFIVPMVGGPPQPAYQPPPYGAPPGYGQPPAPGYPPPPSYPPAQYPGAPGYPPPGYAPAPGYGYAPPAEPPPAIATAPVEEPPPPPAAEEPPAAEPPPPEEPKPTEDPNRIVRIPCPKGHELHTPMSMVGMDAMCPECGEQFTLLYENSIEAREEREAARQRREELMNKRVLQWAIGAAVVVGLGLFTIILIKILKPNPTEETPPPATTPASGASPESGTEPTSGTPPADGEESGPPGDEGDGEQPAPEPDGDESPAAPAEDEGGDKDDEPDE